MFGPGVGEALAEVGVCGELWGVKMDEFQRSQKGAGVIDYNALRYSKSKLIDQVSLM